MFIGREANIPAERSEGSTGRRSRHREGGLVRGYDQSPLAKLLELHRTVRTPSPPVPSFRHHADEPLASLRCQGEARVYQRARRRGVENDSTPVLICARLLPTHCSQSPRM
jgi:hypothetical protein